MFTEAELHALFKTCAGKTFVDRRDTAILMLLVDSGMRRAELSGIRMGDVDLDMQAILVLGKGSRPRQVPFGRKSATAAHMWFTQGGTENGAMQNFGWRSRQMLGRYGASAAAERAREEHKRLSPTDRL